MKSFVSNLTPRDFYRAFAVEALYGKNPLTPEQRFAQACFAQRCRNFFFNCLGVKQTFAAGLKTAQGITPTLSGAVIVHDVLPVVEAFGTNNQSLWNIQLQATKSGYYGDFFGGDGLLPEMFLTHWELTGTLNASGATGPTSPKFLYLAPRLLEPYEQIKINWSQNYSNAGIEFFPEMQFRALRVLPPDNPYAYLSQQDVTSIQNYIASNEPETFFLNVSFALSGGPLPAGPVTIKTPQQGRPLLVLGAISNSFGVQADLYDDSEYYQFTKVDPAAAQYGIPGQGAPINFYQSPQLNLWAPFCDFHPTSAYCMWPVPHLLTPQAQLRIVFSIATQNALGLNSGTSQNNAGATEDLRITFICRTV